MQQMFPRPGYKDAFVDVLGTRVHYLHAGTGQAIVLIHGLVGSCSNWRRNINALAQESSVYAVDMLNMGRSQRIAGLDGGLEATADRLGAIMTALGVTEADVAGHSHGGALALMFAARHPKRVRSLLLFAPANPYSNAKDFLLRFYSTFPGRLVARVGPYLPCWIQLFALGRMYGDPARIVDGCLEGYVQGLRVRGTVSHVLSIVRSWFTDMANLERSLRRVAAIPTLLIWGDRDRAVDPHSALSLHRILPLSELCIVKSGGHVVFEEMPEESNRIMIEWLRGSQAASGLAAKHEGVSNARAGDLPRSAAIAARSGSAAAMQRLPTGT